MVFAIIISAYTKLRLLTGKCECHLGKLFCSRNAPKQSNYVIFCECAGFANVRTSLADFSSCSSQPRVGSGLFLLGMYTQSRTVAHSTQYGFAPQTAPAYSLSGSIVGISETTKFYIDGKGWEGRAQAFIRFPAPPNRKSHVP